MSRLRQLKGFTLIELIVVVIIIGVLAAIAAVAYNQFVTNARSTALTASVTQVAKAISAQTAQDDKFDAASVTAGAGTVSGVTVTTLSAAGNVRVTPNGQTTRSACVSYGTTPAAGSNPTGIVYGNTTVACA